MMSMPTSLGSLIPRGLAARRRRGWHGGAGCARAVAGRGRRPALRCAWSGKGRRARGTDPGTGPSPSARDSLDRHGFREIAGLVDIVPTAIRYVVGEELERHHREDGLEQLFRFGDADDLFSLSGDLVVIIVRDSDQHARASADLFHVAAHL